MRCVALVLCFVVLLAGRLPARSDDDKQLPASRDERSQLRTATVAVLNYWERMLANELGLREQGASCDASANFARETLALARHDLAVLDGNREAARKQMGVVLQSQQVELRRVQRLSSQGSSSAMEVCS